MIAFSDLAQALERRKNLQQYQTEMDQLDKNMNQGSSASSSSPQRGGAAAVAIQKEQKQEQRRSVANNDDMSEPSSFATQPPEDTHEIDVDEMVVDDK